MEKRTLQSSIGKAFLRFVLLLLVGGVFFAIRSAGAASEPGIGPYTVINLPLEDLPALPEDQVYNPVVELTSGEKSRRPGHLPDSELLSGDHSLDTLATAVAHSEEYGLDHDPSQSDPFLQVLYVLEDPREVPLARFAYNSADGVVLPAADMEQLASQSLKTINVYVKVQNLNIKPLTDPLLFSEYADSDWPALYISPLNLELEGISQFPCAAVEYADGTEPYALPVGIDGSGGVGEDGLYNPAAYAPPRPWYYSEESTLQPGEAREGWVSCLAPDVPLEQLQVKAKYRYMREPEVVTFELYTSSPWFPDHEVLASVGLTLADLPGTTSQCDEQDYCASSCSKANEKSAKQGVCVARTDGSGDIALFYGYRIINYDEPVHFSYLVWVYTSANIFPASVIKIDDVPFTLFNDSSLIFGEPLRTYGTVIFYDPRIDSFINDVPIDLDQDTWSGTDEPAPTRQTNIYTFFSKVAVEPYGITTEELDGDNSLRIGVSASAYIEREGEVFIAAGTSSPSFVNPSFSSFGGLDVHQDLDPVTGLIEGVLSFSLGEGRELRPGEEVMPPLLSNTALINIYPEYEEVSPNTNPGIYPANIVTIYQSDSAFVSKTNMCDIVDCIEYHQSGEFSLRGESGVLPKPSRTVPVMCAGEWANNVVMDGLDVVFPVEYIGGAWGLGLQEFNVHKDFSGGTSKYDQYNIFFHNLRFLGGETPWTSIVSGRFYKDIYGKMVDLRTGLPGEPSYNLVDIRPYYSKIGNDPTSGYFVPMNQLLRYSGWLEGLVDQKVLAVYKIHKDYDFGEGLGDYRSFTADVAGFLFMREGPIWSEGCGRDQIPGLTDYEIYAPESVSWITDIRAGQHAITTLLPGMEYPLSLPIVDGKIFSMREYGDIFPDTSARFTVRKVEMVPGLPGKSIIYVPGEDKFYPADRDVSRNNKLFFRNNDAFIIPPDTTYIKVNIGVDYVDSGNSNPEDCKDFENIHLVYPGYLPISGVEVETPYLKQYGYCQGEDIDFWMEYYFPSLNFDQAEMLLTIQGWPGDPWNFWRLLEE